MTWFKVDDGFWSHPKTLTLSHRAVALWTRAGSYCGKHLTDGYVAANILSMLQATPDDADELVQNGLWWACDGGWAFHDWDQYQDTKDAVERRREAWKERAKRRRQNDDDDSHSSLSTIPFHSPDTRDSTRDTPRDSTRDSRRESTRESTRVSTRDIKTPTPPPFRETLAKLEALIAQEQT